MSPSCEAVKCPFCGGEMTAGAVYLSLRLQTADSIRWVPAQGGAFFSWDDDEAVSLEGNRTGQEAGLPLSQQLLGSFPDADAWYCPACGKAVALFQKVETFDPFPHVPDGPLPSTWDILHPERGDKPSEEPPSSPKPRRGKEPWEKKGLFRRKKDKPDWEL